MKLKLWYFINKHAILKKLFFWIFPLLGMSVAKAETIYQCAACPSGLSSNPGAIGSGACFDPLKKAGSQVFSGSTSQSGTLQPGWYRIALRGANGTTNKCDGSYQICNQYGKCVSEICSYGKCSPLGTVCTGNGGAGGSTYYVFYVSVAASYSYTYNSGAPTFTVTESGKTRKFSAGKGAAGVASKSKCIDSSYGKCNKYDCECSNGGAGASNQTSGLFATDKKSSNIDGLSGVGAKLTKL